jgi:hypothetical protein
MKAEGLGLPGSGRPIRDGAHAAHGGILADRRHHCILSQLLRDQPGSPTGHGLRDHPSQRPPDMGPIGPR